jgi:hypothetical protein
MFAACAAIAAYGLVIAAGELAAAEVYPSTLAWFRLPLRPFVPGRVELTCRRRPAASGVVVKVIVTANGETQAAVQVTS